MLEKIPTDVWEHFSTESCSKDSVEVQNISWDHINTSACICDTDCKCQKWR